MLQIRVRVTMQGAEPHGRNINIIPVLGVQAARKLLVSPNLQLDISIRRLVTSRFVGVIFGISDANSGASS